VTSGSLTTTTTAATATTAAAAATARATSTSASMTLGAHFAANKTGQQHAPAAAAAGAAWLGDRGCGEQEASGRKMTRTMRRT